MKELYWDAWNTAHATRHGVTREESTYVVRNARRPYPEKWGDGKYRVCGQTAVGRVVQVIFTYFSPERSDYEQMSYDQILELEESGGPFVYVIHARELTAAEKHRYFKRRH